MECQYLLTVGFERRKRREQREEINQKQVQNLTCQKKEKMILKN